MLILKTTKNLITVALVITCIIDLFTVYLYKYKFIRLKQLMKKRHQPSD